MVSLNDIINITEKHNEIIVETNETSNSRNVLFTYDETKPIIGNVAYDEIYYLDSSKNYMLTKPLGKYVLKNHQLTTLYYMLELEKMLFNVKRIVKDPVAADTSLEVLSSHYTNIGVLSDKVGAGKSYCVMALLNEAKSFQVKQLPFRSATWGCNEIKTNEFTRLNTNILLVPHGLVGQWKKYLEGSGLKFYTIQKAKDIFGLADDDCGFKGKQFSMIAKEDDEIVKPDDGDEDLDNEDLEEVDTASEAAESVSEPLEKTSKTTKSSNSKKSSSRSAKTKQVAIATTDTNTSTGAKKKGTITKRTNTEVAAIQAKKTTQAELEETNKDEANQPTNHELEKEKRKLNAKISQLITTAQNKKSIIYNINKHYNSYEINKAQKEYDAIKQEINTIKKKLML